MDLGTNDTNSSDCYEDFFQSKYVGQVAFRSVFSFVTILFILMMLGIIILFKKYLFFVQRMIMYVALAQLSFSVVAMFDVLSIEAFQNTAALNYCKAIGFATFITLWWTVLTVFVIVIDIFLRIVFAKDTERYEMLYITMIIAPPIIVSWIPFIKQAYGSSLHFCWIKLVNESDCKVFNFGILLRFVLYFIPVYTLTAIIIIMLIIVFIVVRRNKYSGKYDPASKARKAQIIKEMKPLIAYPIIFIVSVAIAIVVTIASTIDEGGNSNYIFTIFSTLIFRLQGILITLVFTLDPETRRKLKWREIRAAAKTFCSLKKEVNKYNVASKARSDSATKPIALYEAREFEDSLDTKSEYVEYK